MATWTEISDGTQWHDCGDWSPDDVTLTVADGRDAWRTYVRDWVSEEYLDGPGGRADYRYRIVSDGGDWVEMDISIDSVGEVRLSIRSARERVALGMSGGTL